MTKLTQERLKEVLDYNPETGEFINKVGRRGVSKKEKRAGGINKTSGYRRISVDRKSYSETRLIWLYVYGYLPENDIDHRDRNRLNNSLKNLREVSRSCNMRNTKVFKNNTSGVQGVTWGKDRNKWRAQVTLNYKTKAIGSFENFNDAVMARWKSEIKYNFPNCQTSSTAFNYLKENNLIND